MPDKLADELAIAKQFGIKPISANSSEFAKIANEGTVKWAITMDGKLLFVPKMNDEIKHSVISSGNAVLSAGEADISVTGNIKHLISISNQTGHFRVDIESVEMALDIFRQNGINIDMTEIISIVE